MSDVADLYRRLFLAQSVAASRGLTRLADAFHDLGEALASASSAHHALLTDLMGGLGAPARNTEAEDATSLERTFLRPHLRVVS